MSCAKCVFNWQMVSSYVHAFRKREGLASALCRTPSRFNQNNLILLPQTPSYTPNTFSPFIKHNKKDTPVSRWSPECDSRAEIAAIVRIQHRHLCYRHPIVASAHTK